MGRRDSTRSPRAVLNRLLPLPRRLHPRPDRCAGLTQSLVGELLGVPHSRQRNIPTPNSAPAATHHQALALVSRALTAAIPMGADRSLLFQGNLFSRHSARHRFLGNFASRCRQTHVPILPHDPIGLHRARDDAGCKIWLPASNASSIPLWTTSPTRSTSRTWKAVSRGPTERTPPSWDSAIRQKRSARATLISSRRNRHGQVRAGAGDHPHRRADSESGGTRWHRALGADDQDAAAR